MPGLLCSWGVGSLLWREIRMRPLFLVAPAGSPSRERGVVGEHTAMYVICTFPVRPVAASEPKSTAGSTRCNAPRSRAFARPRACLT
jgi:hypothetical protein